MAVGDTNLFFNRDTKVYAVQYTGTATANVWQLPVLNGYSFSQATNASQVTLNEMASATGNSRRGQFSFNDSLAPAEWSFDLYARPTAIGVTRAPEELLWHSMFSEAVMYPAAGMTGSISTTGWSYATTTITLNVTAHPYRAGDAITVTGLTATTNAPNGTFVITSVTATTIVYTVASAPTGTAAGTGTITGGYLISAAPSYTAGTNTVRLTFANSAPAGGTYFKLGDTITVSGLTYTGGTPSSGTNNFVVTATDNTSVSFICPTGTTAVAFTATSATVVSATFTSTASALDFFPAGSNKTKLGTFDLYFVLGATKATTADTYPASELTTIYKIANCCVNEATVNFEIDGITTISFSGMGTLISELASWTFTGSVSNPDQSPTTVNHTLFNTGVTSTSNMIRNRLTSLSIVGTNPGINSGNAKTYSITLTGGSITISNNMNFLTPESIGVVNQPLGHVTGTRSVSGSFTCYADELTNGSIDLYQDLLTATNLITNKHQLQFFIGGRGGTAGFPASPGLMFDLGQCHLEVPSVNIDDVIGFEVNFTALPTTISGTDEITKIRYVA